MVALELTLTQVCLARKLSVHPHIDFLLVSLSCLSRSLLSNCFHASILVFLIGHILVEKRQRWDAAGIWLDQQRLPCGSVFIQELSNTPRAVYGTNILFSLVRRRGT